MAPSALSTEVVVLDPSLYPEDCVHAAVSAYAPFADVALEVSPDAGQVLRITVQTAATATTVRREFLNYVLDLALRHHLASD